MARVAPSFEERAERNGLDWSFESELRNGDLRWFVTVGRKGAEAELIGLASFVSPFAVYRAQRGSTNLATDDSSYFHPDSTAKEA